jgi:hypothetical protein
MRIATVSALLMFGAATAGAAGVERTIDLDSAGTLDAIAASNPGLHRKIVEIVRVSADLDCVGLPKALQVRFDVVNARCSPYAIMTSLPPKRHLYFVLDGTGYVINLTIPDASGKLIPAK